MGRVAPVYPTFAKGEVSPLMFGRIDIEQYPSCLDKCRNMWVRPYGCASRVVGTEYIQGTKNNSYARLLKFVFSATDAYIIEVGAGYFRFYNDGGYVLKEDADNWTTGTAYKVGNFVKESDTIYYCVEAHTAGTFATDLENGKWVEQNIYEIPNDFTESQIDSLQYVQLDDIIKFTCLPANDDNKTARPRELIRNAPDDWEFKEVEFKSTPYLDENTTDITLTASAATGDITVTASSSFFKQSHVGAYFWIGGTQQIDGEDVQGFFKVTSYNSATSVGAKVQSKLSTTSATKIWGEGAWSDYRGWPAVIGLFDGRLYYARTPHQPRNVYGSVPYAYEKYTPAVNNEDDGAINIELATNANGDGSDIKWLMGASYLLCGTYGGEFVIKGTGDGAITPTDISAKQRSNWGGEAIQPVVAGSFVHFIQRNGAKLRQFQYDYYYDTYKAVDVSIFSEHFFESGIRQIAYQKNTDSIIYLLRNDGKVVLLTLEQDQSVQAWSLLDFDGIVESIETIPSYTGQYDEVWFVIKRIIDGNSVRYVERMQDPITPDIQQDCWYVRSGLAYNAFDATKENDLTLSAKTGTITVTAANSIFTSNSVGKRIRVIDDKANVISQAIITEYTSGTVVAARVIKDFQVTSIAGGSWGLSIGTLNGLSHLEGKEVQILADGAEQTPQTVENGSITLELDGWKVIVGLGYQSYITTMPLEAGSQNGTAVGKRKRINELSLRVWRTLGCRVGTSLNNLQNVGFRNPQTEMGLPEPLYTGIIPNIKYNQGWVWDANVTVEQSRPFPMNILTIAPIVTEVDK